MFSKKQKFEKDIEQVHVDGLRIELELSNLGVNFLCNTELIRWGELTHYMPTIPLIIGMCNTLQSH